MYTNTKCLSSQMYPKYVLCEALCSVSFIISALNKNILQYGTSRSQFRCYALDSVFTIQEYYFYAVVKVANGENIYKFRLSQLKQRENKLSTIVRMPVVGILNSLILIDHFLFVVLKIIREEYTG